MSERPVEQGSLGSPTKDAGNGSTGRQTRSPPFSSTVERPSSTSRSALIASPSAQRQADNPGRIFELPPLPSASSNPTGRFLPSVDRLGGVSSILNPPEHDDTQSARRRKASQLESPASSTTSLPPILSGSHALQTASAIQGQLSGSQQSDSVERPPRRIITPRSPSLHRAASLGQLNPSAGTISAQSTPFPTSPRGRYYTVEPGTSGAPPLPAPVAARSGYGLPAPTPPLEAARRASGGNTRGRGLSSSASPSTSYSEYSQTGQASPAVQYDPASLSTLSAPYTGSESAMGGTGSASAPPSALGPGHRQMGIPISSSGGQNVYQMFTLETTNGTVQLPVDVQAASRVADEKRRRNAGASARFRQRRKEKEKEATTSIARLEQQNKELSEDAEFYRRERDFLAGILSHIPGGERHFPRPSSPRHRRASAISSSSQVARESGGYSAVQEQPPRSREDGRNVRRRTSTFSLPPPPTQHQRMPVPGVAIQPHFAPMGQHPPPSSLQSPSGPLSSPGSRGPLPFPSQIPPGQPSQPPSGPPQVLQAMPQTGPWNPYASDRRPSGPSSQQHETR